MKNLLAWPAVVPGAPLSSGSLQSQLLQCMSPLLAHMAFALSNVRFWG
jgi:hypothetical protein